MLKKVSTLKASFPSPEFGREKLFEGMNVIVRRMFPINLFEFSQWYVIKHSTKN